MTNKELVQLSFENFGKGNIPGILEILSDDIIWEMNGPAHIPFAGSRKGKEAVLDFFIHLAATSDFQSFTPKEFIAEGDKVVALGEAVATNKQTGKQTKNNWAMAWTFSNGKVTHYYNYSDTYAVAETFAQ